MFNTGARVQEVLDLRARDLQLIRPFQVRLTGKGRKQRCCPLWPQTAQLLHHLCDELNIDLMSDVRIFQNSRSFPLTRFGVRYILSQCLKRAQVTTPSLRSKRLHPHSMRHSTAVALLKSGVDLSTIGQWLGHSSLTTTNRYAAIDLEMKRTAIASLKPVTGPRARTTPWRHDNSVLEWLESLWPANKCGVARLRNTALITKSDGHSTLMASQHKSKKITFIRSLFALEKRNKWPLSGSIARQLRTIPYKPLNPFRMSIAPVAT
jgi:hypothetical protein